MSAEDVRLVSCPHERLFGIPNGMTREQVREHDERCIRVDGRWRKVLVGDEEYEGLRSATGPLWQRFPIPYTQTGV